MMSERIYLASPHMGGSLAGFSDDRLDAKHVVGSLERGMNISAFRKRLAENIRKSKD